MKLNCDLGESYGAWQMSHDDLLMPYVDMASIACGYHGGDPVVIQNAIGFAKASNVMIGAHPSYPDRQGFGRRSMKLTQAEIIAMLHYQISALEGMAAIQGQHLQYVKPHGALYNDMMTDEKIFTAVLSAMQGYSRPLDLVIQATVDWQEYQRLASHANITLMFEAFADRSYLDNGALMPRDQVNAVLDLSGMLTQVADLLNDGTVRSHNGKTLALKVDTLCVHGDSADAIDAVKNIRLMLDER